MNHESVNSLQMSIEVMATQLFYAFVKRRPDLCASCYEQYGILNFNGEENLIGKSEIKLYWEQFVSSGVKALARSIPSVTFQKPHMFLVQSTWLLSTGKEIQLHDTWVKQENGVFKLLIQNIKGTTSATQLKVA